GTDLEARLRADSRDAIVIAGVITNNSVEATVRMAGNLGFATYSSRTAALPLVARIGTARSEAPKMFTQCHLPILTASIAASSQRHRYSVRRPDSADVYGSFACPLWVKRRHLRRKRSCLLLPPTMTAKANFRTRSCLLYPQKRTCGATRDVCFGPKADIVSII